MNRRDFIAKSIRSTVALAGLGLVEQMIKPLSAQSSLVKSQLSVAKNGNPAEMTRFVVQALGGMNQFVKKGQTVLVKPNIGWDRTPEQAANTNPEVVAELVKMCYEVGAKKVWVLDRTCNEARRCYLHSRIEEYAKNAGAQVRHIANQRFKNTTIPNAIALDSWPVYQDVFDADVLINVPVAKHHSMSRLSLGLKNLMGIMGGNRGKIHAGFDQKIVDFNKIVIPNLTVMDAYRTLMRNGPQGGNLADVRLTAHVIAGTDRVAVDSYTATLFDIKPTDLEWLSLAAEQGLGDIDLSRFKIILKDFAV